MLKSCRHHSFRIRWATPSPQPPHAAGSCNRGHHFCGRGDAAHFSKLDFICLYLSVGGMIFLSLLARSKQNSAAFLVWFNCSSLQFWKRVNNRALFLLPHKYLVSFSQGLWEKVLEFLYHAHLPDLDVQE